MVAPPRLEADHRRRGSRPLPRVRRRADPARHPVPTTRRSYERDVTEFARLAGPVRVLDDVTGEDVDDVLLRYQTTPDGRYADASRKPGSTGRSAATVNRFRQSVTRFFAHAAREGWVQADPMQWAAPRPVCATGCASPAPRCPRARRRRCSRCPPPARPGSCRLAPRPGPSAPRPPRRRAPAGPRPARVRARAREPRRLLPRTGPDAVAHPGQGRPRAHRHAVSPLADALEEYLARLRPTLLARRPDDPDAQRALLLSWRGRRIDAQAVRGLLRRCVERMPRSTVARRRRTRCATRPRRCSPRRAGTSRSWPSSSGTRPSRPRASTSIASRASWPPRSGPTRSPRRSSPARSDPPSTRAVPSGR